MLSAEQLLQPFAEYATGIDPRYSDAFQAIKQQIEKISGTDFQLVQQLCQTVLLEQAKDLRVAGYLVLAATQLQGLAGFIASLTTYQLLLENFGEKLFPEKLEAKLAALKWLNNSRLNSLLSNLSNITEQDAAQLLAIIPAFNTAIKQVVQQDLNIFSHLMPMLQAQKQQLKSREQQPVENLQNFNSYSAVERAALEIIHYYQAQQNLVAAAMYTRTLRWAEIKLPPHEDFRTKIPAPRAQGLAKLENLLTTGDAAAIYFHCESLLLEPSYHLLFDLQYYAHNAAKALADENLMLYLEAALKDLLKRFPLLIQLEFDNKQAFASPITKNWLYELLKENNSEPAAEAAAESFCPENIVRNAKQNAVKKSLPSLLNYIDAIENKNAAMEFQKNHAKAKLCLEHKRTDIAIYLLEELAEKINYYQLIKWQPALALAVWLDLITALNTLLKKTNDSTKLQLQEKINSLKKLIAQADTVQALQLV